MRHLTCCARTQVGIFVLRCLLPALVGCVGGVASTLTKPAALADASVRSALVGMIADSTRGQIQMDPLPLPARLDEAGGSTTPTIKSVEAGEVVGTLADLWDVAVRSAPEAIRRECASVMAAPLPGATYTGCPREPLTIVVLGQPHPPTELAVDSLRRTVAVPDSVPSLRFVNVLETSVTSRGRFTRAWTYVVAQRHDQWALVTRIRGVIIE